jgi:hypothetical protein
MDMLFCGGEDFGNFERLFPSRRNNSIASTIKIHT